MFFKQAGRQGAGMRHRRRLSESPWCGYGAILGRIAEVFPQRPVKIGYWLRIVKTGQEDAIDETLDKRLVQHSTRLAIILSFSIFVAKICGGNREILDARNFPLPQPDFSGPDRPGRPEIMDPSA